ncbi:MAG: hypothetical protein WEF86_16425 [Gemmatimonadota bacterium]
MRHGTRLILLSCVLCLAPGTADAQELADYDYENLTFRGIGFDYGYIWPSKVEATPVYSMRLDLGFLGPAIRISPSISYWSSEFRTRQLDHLADRLNQLPPLAENGVALTAEDLGTIEWSDLAVAVDAHVVWTAPLNIITFLGAGAALHALNGRGAVVDDTFIEDQLDSTSAGVALMGGVEVQPIPRLRLYGEARYTMVSDIFYPGLRFGASLMLPTAGATTPEGAR